MVKKKAIEGDLEFLSLGNLLQLLSSDDRSGVLYLYNNNFNEPGLIYIKNGNPIDASSSNLKGNKALYSLFGWISGRFEFYQEDIKRLDSINKRMMAVVLDALRVLDEGKIKKYYDKSSDEQNSYNIKGLIKKTNQIIRGPFIEYSSVVDEDEYQDRSSIVVQGRHGNWLWVVIDGCVEINKITDNGSILVMTVGPGAFIGSLSTILQPDKTRTATAVAKGNVQLGVIDTQKIYNELSYLSNNFRDLILSLDKRLKKITQRYANIRLGDNSNDEFPMNIKKIINQGDNVQKVFKIIEGEAFIIKKIKSKEINLIKLEQGDFIGDVPFFSLNYEPFSVSIYATDDLKLEIIDINKMYYEYDNLSITVKNIIEYTSMCISITTNNVCT